MGVLNPNSVIWFPETGLANMGDVTDEQSVARFTLNTEKFILVAIRGSFVGGSGSADLAIKLDKSLDPRFNHTLFTVNGCGSSKPLHFRVPDDEIDRWVFNKNDYLVLEWTNPDPGNMEWAVEVGLIDARTRG